MNLPRLLLNDEGYILYRWARLRWRRRRARRLPVAIVAEAALPPAQPVMIDAEVARRVLDSIAKPTAKQPCISCLAVFKTYVYTHGDCGVKPADFYEWSVPEVKHAQLDVEMYGRQYIVMPNLSASERLALLGSMADAHERIGTPQNRARISDLGRLVTAPRADIPKMRRHWK